MTALFIQNAVFYFFALCLVFSAIMVILARNPVSSALFLVYSFFNTAILWMLLQAEFLSLVLIFVYVGAVMTLFLFVVMMLNIDVEVMKKSALRYLPLILIALAGVIGLMLVAFWPSHLGTIQAVNPTDAVPNTQALGQLLYTHYVYAFEIAGMVLLVAIVAAIHLAQRTKPNRKIQVIREQVAVQAKDRLKWADLSHKPGRGEDAP